MRQCKDNVSQRTRPVIDIAKGIGIILVVIGHAYAQYASRICTFSQDSMFYSLWNHVESSTHTPVHEQNPSTLPYFS